jgi:Spy/CpxP family protein refolding chaperone
MDKRWKVMLAFAGIFATGGVTGALVALRLAAPAPAPVVVQAPATDTPPTAVSTVSPAPAPAPLTPPEQLGPQLFRRLTNQLGLTPAQRQKVRPIELRATEELNRLRRDSVHATQVLIDKNEDEIRALLDPEQAAKFDILVAGQRDRIQKFVIEQQNRQRELRQKMLPAKNGNVMATPASAPVAPSGAAEPKK